MARLSTGIGEYSGCIWTVTLERPVSGMASIFLTVPTRTPEILTSASWASCPASLNGTVKR